MTKYTKIVVSEHDIHSLEMLIHAAKRIPCAGGTERYDLGHLVERIAAAKEELSK